MASQIISTEDLIAEVRSLLDEDNVESVDDDLDILPALNRAQNYASNILARHYDAPLIAKRDVVTVPGQEQYQIPEDALEERIEKLEVKINNLFYPMIRISYRDISLYDAQDTTSVPYYYTVIGNYYQILPSSTGTYPLRIWYTVDPLKLVKPQGRINVVNESSTNPYVIVDSVGSDLTTEADNLNSYLNVIDAQSGKRKASFQIKTITSEKIEFKISPARSSVLNVPIDNSTVSTDLLSNVGSDRPDVSIEPDDFVCVVKGGCVPFFKKPFTNFLIQYAVAEIRRKLGGPVDDEQQVLEKLEQQVERSWVGREQDLRVTKSNNHWSLPIRRYYGARS